MSRRVVYCAGPYAGPTASDVARNVARARAVGALAVAQGYAPIVPHLLGASGIYGAGDGADDGSESAARTAAIDCSVAMVRCVDDLWAIARDDGTLSAGTQAELRAWSFKHETSDVDGGRSVVQPWAEWRALIEAAGLGAYLADT